MLLAQGLSQAATKVLAGSGVIVTVHWGKLWFQVHYHGCWQASRARWLSAGDIGFLSHGPLHRTAHNMAAGFPQSQQVREHKKVPEMEATVFL